MSSFVYIISKLYPNINVSEVAFFSSTVGKKNKYNTDFVSYAFINALRLKPSYTLIQSKYKILFQSIINNKFVDNSTKARIMNNFYKAQRIYFAFSRQAYLFKLKKAKIYDVNTDLCMEPLCNFKDSMLLEVYDDVTKNKYLYRTSDIINIICTSLSNSPDFFTESLFPKNPYTNIDFTYAQLYNMYFSIRESNYIMPTLLLQFFLKNFDITTFSRENECYIRDYAIKYFNKNSSQDDKYLYIKDLLIEYANILKSIVIHSEFPRDKLIETFQIYLEDFLTIHYSLNPVMRSSRKRKLRKDLYIFNKLNPTFGRKIYYKRNIVTYSQASMTNPTRRNSPGGLIFNDGRGDTNYSHRFVDNVFVRDDIEGAPTNEALHQMGLSSNQTIIPPLSNTLPREPISPVSDSPVPDSPVSDSPVPDSPVSDSSVPDSSVPDSSVPDSSVPDSSVPDSSVPDSSVPDSSVPGAITETFRISMDRALENLRRANSLASGGTISPTNSPDNSISQEPAIHIANIVIDENGMGMQGDNEPASEETTNTIPLTTSHEPSISSDEE